MTGKSDGDEFMDSMWQHMQDVNKECTRMLNQLRRENRDLVTKLASAKERYYELQEQNIAMQSELARRCAHHGQPKD